MNDSRKTKKGLLSELERLRTQVAELERGLRGSVQQEDLAKQYEQLRKTMSARTGELMMVSQELRRQQSARERAEQAYLNATGILDKLFSTPQISIAFLDSELHFVRVNEGYAARDGRPADFFIGKRFFEVYPNEEHEAIFRRVAQTGEPHSLSAAPFTHPEHPERATSYWDCSLLPIRGSSHEVEGLLFCAIEVTGRILTETALRESEERYRLHFENVSDVVYVTGRDFRIIDVSPSVKALLGYSPEEIIGRRIDELNLLAPEYVETGVRNTLRILAGEKSGPTEYEFITKEGERKFGEISGSPLWKGGEVVASIAVARDITNRKHVESELERYRLRLEEMVEQRTDELMQVNRRLEQEVNERKKAEERLRAQVEFSKRLIDSSADGIIAFDRETRFTAWNPPMERVTGVPKEQALGKKAADMFPYLKETGEERNYLAVLSGQTITSRERPYYIQETGREGFYEAHYSPLRNETGEIIGGLAIIRDITQRKQFEEAVRESEEKYRHLSESLEVMVKKQVAELKQAERLAAIGKMISVVAHEIRNPLQNVQLGFETLRIISTESEHLEILDDIERGLDMLSGIMEELLDFARPARLNRRRCAFEAVVRHAVNLVQPKLHNINIRIDTHELDEEVFIDDEKMSRVLVNLIVNAVEAMGGGGELRVQCGLQEEAMKRCLSICVSDTGCGIPEDILLLVEEPFFTTKPRGTGLGLSICKKIIEAHGGRMRITSRPGEGTNVEITLPFEFRATGGPDAAF